jgi:hypothetical protein
MYIYCISFLQLIAAEAAIMRQTISNLGITVTDMSVSGITVTNMYVACHLNISL